MKFHTTKYVLKRIIWFIILLLENNIEVHTFTMENSSRTNECPPKDAVWRVSRRWEVKRFPLASELLSTVVRLVHCLRISHRIRYSSRRRKKTPGRRACNVTSLQLFWVVAECEPDRLVIFAWISQLFFFFSRLSDVSTIEIPTHFFIRFVALNDNRKIKIKNDLF